MIIITRDSEDSRIRVLREIVKIALCVWYMIIITSDSVIVSIAGRVCGI